MGARGRNKRRGKDKQSGRVREARLMSESIQGAQNESNLKETKE